MAGVTNQGKSRAGCGTNARKTLRREEGQNRGWEQGVEVHEGINKRGPRKRGHPGGEEHSLEEKNGANGEEQERGRE